VEDIEEIVHGSGFQPVSNLDSHIHDGYDDSENNFFLEKEATTMVDC
jgi:hypothetical protein